jgi:hypothetical protein
MTIPGLVNCSADISQSLTHSGIVTRFRCGGVPAISLPPSASSPYNGRSFTIQHDGQSLREGMQCQLNNVSVPILDYSACFDPSL